MRAVDGWDSVAFSGFYYLRVLSAPKHYLTRPPATNARRWADTPPERCNVSKELETVYVDFGDISAQATIERLVELVGIEAVKSAIDEIAAQQSAH